MTGGVKEQTVSEQVPNPNSREPLLSRAIVAAVVAEVVTLAVSFGLPLSDAQQKGVTALAVLVIPWRSRGGRGARSGLARR